MTETEINRVLTAIDLALSVFRGKKELPAAEKALCEKLTRLRHDIRHHAGPGAKPFKAGR